MPPAVSRIINAVECATELLQEERAELLRDLLGMAGLEALPDGLADATLSSRSMSNAFAILPPNEAFDQRSVPLPASPPPLTLCIRIDPRGDVSCFFAAALLLLRDEARRLPIFLNVGDSLTTPVYRPGEHVTFSPFFAAVLDLAGRRVIAAYVKDVYAFDLVVPRLGALEILVVPAAGLAHAATIILPPCLLSAPATLKTLVVSSYERTPACGTLHLPPSLTRLKVTAVQQPVREALLAAIDTQKIALSSLTLHFLMLDRTEYEDWLRVVGASLSSLSLLTEALNRHYAPSREEVDDFLSDVQRYCHSLRHLGFSFSNLHHRGNDVLTFSPSRSLPASLRSLRIWAYIRDRRHIRGSCGGLLDLLNLAARHGGIEDLSFKVHASNLWHEDTPMAIARAAAPFPLRKLYLSLTCSQGMPAWHHPEFVAWADSSAWVLPLLPLLPSSLEHLDLCFHSSASILPAVLRSALRGLPNLRHLGLDGKSDPGAEAVVATLRELDGTFPLRHLLLFSESLGAAECEAELRRWEREVREAARSRASWAILRKGIESGQERRVAEAAFGSPPGLSSMERLPARALMTVSECLAYPADPRVNVC